MNKRKELQGLVEPAHMAAPKTKRRMSRAEELGEELANIKDDLLHRQGQISMEEPLVDNSILSNAKSGARHNLQLNESKKENKKKKMGSSQSIRSYRSTPRQPRHGRQRNQGRPSRLNEDKSRQPSQDNVLSPVESTSDEVILCQSNQSDTMISSQISDIQASSTRKIPRDDEIPPEPGLGNRLEPEPLLGTTGRFSPVITALQHDTPEQDIARETISTVESLKVNTDVAHARIGEASHHENQESEPGHAPIPFPIWKEVPEAKCNATLTQREVQYSPIEEDVQDYQESPSVDTLINGGSSPTDSGYCSPSMDTLYAFASELQGLKWTYTMPGTPYETLTEAGVWQWETPIARCWLLPELELTSFKLAPVTVSQETTGTTLSRIDFNGGRICIVPHAIPWDDERSDISHPDFLVTSKIAEYQACEAAGHPVWRHDRDLLDCRRCGLQISDYCHSTVICSGCGPESVVRYCCFQHHVADSDQHWQECGHPALVMRNVIDHTTEPAHFETFCPAIQEKHGIRSQARHRQRLLASVTYGLYTLFFRPTGESKTLLWPKEDPACIEMSERIERLLSVALFDCNQRVIIDYLYRLLRECLYQNGDWTIYTGQTLNAQIISEFGRTLFDPLSITNGGYCECEWYGKLFPSSQHALTCAIMQNGQRSTHGIKGLVENLEETHWILRVWRQQHSTLSR